MASPCVTCGVPAQRVDFARDGDVIDFGFICEPCLDAAFDRFEILKAEFDALLDAGVSRKEANRIMIDRIEGHRTAH